MTNTQSAFEARPIDDVKRALLQRIGGAARRARGKKPKRRAMPIRREKNI